MRYRLKLTSEDIISELSYPAEEQCLNCDDCGDIIEAGGKVLEYRR